MRRELIQDYLVKSGMQADQAHTLSQILEETATRSDLALLRHRIDGLEDRLERRFEVMDSRLEGLGNRLAAEMVAVQSSLTAHKADVLSRIDALEARLTWRMVSAIVFVGTVMTLLDLFID